MRSILEESTTTIKKKPKVNVIWNGITAFATSEDFLFGDFVVFPVWAPLVMVTGTTLTVGSVPEGNSRRYPLRRKACFKVLPSAASRFEK